MNFKERIELKNLISQYGAKDNTQIIRDKQASKYIYDDVIKMEYYIKKHPEKTKEELDAELMVDCKYLCTEFHQLFKIICNKKTSFDFETFYVMLKHLEKIENGVDGQHEISYELGKFLQKQKELTTQSASNVTENESQTEPKITSWKMYKASKK
jgi:hypothetical protein